MSDRRGLAQGWGRGIAAVALFLLWLPEAALATPLPGTIMGTVRLLSDQSALQNQTVRLSQGGQVIDTELTDGDGEYIFTPLSAGTYTLSVVPYPAETYEAPVPRTVGLANGATEIVDFNLQQAGEGGPYILNWWVKDSTINESGKYVNPTNGPEVAGDCNTFLIIPQGANVARVTGMEVVSACGHTAYSCGEQDFTPYTWNDPVVPQGTNAYNHWWISPALHNGAATMTIFYTSWEGEQEAEHSATLGIVVHNFEIVPVVDADHPAQLKWDPTDPDGGQGRTKLGISFALKYGAKTSLPVDRRIFPLHHAAYGGQLRSDTRSVTTSGDWDNPVVVDWDWDGTDGDEAVMPKGIYPFGIYTWDADNPIISGGGDTSHSYWLVLSPAETPPSGSGRTADEVAFLGYDLENGALRFVVDYGAQDHAPGTTTASSGHLLVFGPDHTLVHDFDIADLDCLEHEDDDGLFVAPPGQRHRLEAHVPASEMTAMGKYTFMVVLVDNNERWHHAHRLTSALEVGQGWTQIDLDVDSDNNNGYEAPDRSVAEDAIEDDEEEPGKEVIPNANDDDEDGVPDFADGYNLTADSRDDSNSDEHFVPCILQVPAHIDPQVATIAVSYSHPSDPAAVTVTGEGSEMIWHAGPNGFRLWKKAGNEARDGRAVSLGGDYIPPGTYTAAQLGVAGDGAPVTLYLEAISDTKITDRLVMSCDPDGPGGFASAGDYTDAVRINDPPGDGFVPVFVNTQVNPMTIEFGEAVQTESVHLYWAVSGGGFTDVTARATLVGQNGETTSATLPWPTYGQEQSDTDWLFRLKVEATAVAVAGVEEEDLARLEFGPIDFNPWSANAAENTITWGFRLPQNQRAVRVVSNTGDGSSPSGVALLSTTLAHQEGDATDQWNGLLTDTLPVEQGPSYVLEAKYVDIHGTEQVAARCSVGSQLRLGDTRQFGASALRQGVAKVRVRAPLPGNITATWSGPSLSRLALYDADGQSLALVEAQDNPAVDEQKTTVSFEVPHTGWYCLQAVPSELAAGSLNAVLEQTAVCKNPHGQIPWASDYWSVIAEGGHHRWQLGTPTSARAPSHKLTAYFVNDITFPDLELMRESVAESYLHADFDKDNSSIGPIDLDMDTNISTEKQGFPWVLHFDRDPYHYGSTLPYGTVKDVLVKGDFETTSGIDVNKSGSIEPNIDSDRLTAASVSAGWWGHCISWAYSAVLEKMPVGDHFRQRATPPTTFKFTAMDRAGLLTMLYVASGANSQVVFGYDKQTITGDPFYPGEFHRALQDHLLIGQTPLVGDGDRGSALWANPYYGYHATITEPGIAKQRGVYGHGRDGNILHQDVRSAVALGVAGDLMRTGYSLDEVVPGEQTVETLVLDYWIVAKDGIPQKYYGYCTDHDFASVQGEVPEVDYLVKVFGRYPIRPLEHSMEKVDTILVDP